MEGASYVAMVVKVNQLVVSYEHKKDIDWPTYTAMAACRNDAVKALNRINASMMLRNIHNDLKKQGGERYARSKAEIV